VLQHVQAVVDEVRDTELVAVQRLVAPLQAEPEVIGRDAGRGPELPVIEPAPGLGLDARAALRHQPHGAVARRGEPGDRGECAGRRWGLHRALGGAGQERGVGAAVVVDRADDDPTDVDAEDVVLRGHAGNLRIRSFPENYSFWMAYNYTAMKLEWLEAFVVFAERLSFTRAARDLHISQPALHVQIARLADALGAPLYRRDGRALALTPQGLDTLRLAREIRDRAHELAEVVRTGGSARPVVLAAGEGAYLYLLGEAISRFTARAVAPLRLLTHNAEATIAALGSGQAHLGVAGLHGPPTGIDAEPLVEAPLILAMPAGHPLARRRRIGLTDLQGARLVVPPDGRPLRSIVAAALLSAGVRWEVAVEAVGWPLTLHFVQLGAGLAIVNAICRLPPGVVARPVPALPSTHYWLLGKPRTPAMQELAQMIRLAVQHRSRPRR
jgi:DNA-binding transcriptional LysR family regulator